MPSAARRQRARPGPRRRASWPSPVVRIHAGQISTATSGWREVVAARNASTVRPVTRASTARDEVDRASCPERAPHRRAPRSPGRALRGVAHGRPSSLVCRAASRRSWRSSRSARPRRAAASRPRPAVSLQQTDARRWTHRRARRALPLGDARAALLLLHAGATGTGPIARALIASARGSHDRVRARPPARGAQTHEPDGATAPTERLPQGLSAQCQALGSPAAARTRRARAGSRAGARRAASQISPAPRSSRGSRAAPR